MFYCLASSHGHARCGSQVCTAIKPESNEAVYLMLLDKSPTQEEFIRGQLTNNPYNSAEVGPLMRDVKNFICRELDMEGDRSVLEAFAWHAGLGHNMLLQQPFLHCALPCIASYFLYFAYCSTLDAECGNMYISQPHTAAHLRRSWLALCTSIRETTICLSHHNRPSTVLLMLL